MQMPVIQRAKKIFHYSKSATPVIGKRLIFTDINWTKILSRDSVWVRKLVSDIKGGTKIRDVSEQGA
jgi:hypothetical protein